MADAIIGALRVILGADTATFEEGMEKAAGKLTDFEKFLKKIATTLAAAFTFDAIIKGIQNTINHMEQLGDTAEKIAFPVEDLSALEHAATLANVSMDTLSTSMGRLAKNMAAAAKDGASPAAEAFKALGINVENTDGTLKSSNDVLLQVAQAFSRYEDSAEKTALAIAIFGRAGAEMIPLLNQGAAGIAAARAEAQAFGIILDKDAVEAAKRFNDNLDRIGAQLRGVFVQAVTQNTAAMDSFAAAIMNVTSNAEIMQPIVTALGGFMKILAFLAISAGLAFADFARDIRLWVEVAKAAATLSGTDLAAAFKKWKTETDAAHKAANEAGAALFGFGLVVDTTRDNFERMGESWKKTFFGTGEAPPLIKATTNAVEEFIQSTQRQLTAQQAEVAAFGLAAGVRERLRIVMAASNLEMQKGITLTKEQRDEIERLGNDAEMTAAKLATMNKIEDALPSWQKYQNEILRTREEFQKAGKDLDDFQNVQKNIAEKFGVTWDEIATKTVDGWSKALTTIAKENKQFAVAAKALAITQALISTYTGAAKALEIGFPPFNFIAAAGVVAAGLAYVGQIAAQQFAKGGSFRVGGGITGIDSELVAFRATPGEMVDIRRPGQDRGGGVQTINLGLPSPNEFFAQHVREMVNVLNRAAPDGYVLKVAPA